MSNACLVCTCPKPALVQMRVFSIFCTYIDMEVMKKELDMDPVMCREDFQNQMSNFEPGSTSPPLHKKYDE